MSKATLQDAACDLAIVADRQQPGREREFRGGGDVNTKVTKREVFWAYVCTYVQEGPGTLRAIWLCMIAGREERDFVALGVSFSSHRSVRRSCGSSSPVCSDDTQCRLMLYDVV